MAMVLCDVESVFLVPFNRALQMHTFIYIIIIIIIIQ